MMSYQFLLTIDVEDWFQVENFKEYIPFSSWPSYELRVEKNTYRLLDLLDSMKLNNIITSNNTTNASNPTNPNNTSNSNNSTNYLSATFFILGWIAERLPGLVREIHSRGHEVASHGYGHTLCTKESTESLREDLRKSKKLLEDITGTQVHGYRAPSFSITNDILRIIEDSGYTYDSSFNSFGMNSRYGHIDLSSIKKTGIAHKISDAFHEIPISNLTIGNITLPWGGGGYFRLMPSPAFRCGVRSILKNDSAYMFYMHPWEIDPEQPRVKQASMFYKFRHYINIEKTERRLKNLIKDMGECTFVNCNRYIEGIR